MNKSFVGFFAGCLLVGLSHLHLPGGTDWIRFFVAMAGLALACHNFAGARRRS